MKKIRQMTALFWFGGLDCGMLEFFTHVIQRTLVVSPAFLEQGSAEKIAHTNHDPNRQDD
jgi:hypothetical protein